MESIIKDYFNWYYKNLKLQNESSIELERLVYNSNIIKFKMSKLRFMVKWFKKLDEEIKDYKIYIKIKEITFKEDTIYVDLFYGDDLVLKKSENVTQKLRNQFHKIILKNINNNLFIIDDYYNDHLADEFFMVNDDNINRDFIKENINKKIHIKTLEFNNNLKRLDKLAKEYEENLKKSSSKNLNKKNIRNNFNYDGNEAKNYAVKYSLDYNPFYSDYNGKGGDCTNFVSQCIKAGGIPTDYVWFKDSNAWIRVRELRYWLINKGYCRELKWQEKSKEGDLVQLENNYGIIYHSLIITYKSYDNQLFVSSHSGDYYNRALETYITSRRYLILTS
ncbi:amidase domain-containing protein [Clostridium fallax]|uniref:Putative amidase domain-containing protein n=1 Tax=Clostridium fallax TaxID=1533 RepID=A0A1M4XTZ5_9CLOT|nr:amidase domain-containing protein [Clostridium fallax]SHE96951.1 Putative amidase domain-containing protein [Clostridium fallax]SQB06538.1 methylase [Clostridium fallax]